MGIAALDVTEVTESSKEGPVPRGGAGSLESQPADSSDLGRLLRLHGKRRGEEAARKRLKEDSTLHY